MARTPAQRGTFGRWLTRVREERYPERQADALADMRRLAGLVISPSEYAQWESGSRVPRLDNPKRERLYEFFGSRPEDVLERPESPDATADAIDRQTDVLRLLVEETRKAREAQEITAQAVGEMVGRLDQFLGLVGRQAEPEPANGGGSR